MPDGAPQQSGQTLCRLGADSSRESRRVGLSAPSAAAPHRSAYLVEEPEHPGSLPGPPPVRASTRPGACSSHDASNASRAGCGSDTGDALLDEQSAIYEWAEPRAVRRIMPEHRVGRRDHARAIWRLLMLDRWCRRLATGDLTHAVTVSHDVHALVERAAADGALARSA